MNADDIRMAIRKRFGDSERYVVAEEVGLTTGMARRRIDMMVLDCYYSSGFRIDGFEIKISTADLRRELADPDKHVAFFGMIDFYTLAVPKGVVEPLEDIIPKTWGILIVNDDGTTRYKRKPLALEDNVKETVPRGFFASVVRQVQRRQPSKAELDAQYHRGFDEGARREKDNRDYAARRLDDNIEKLKDYEKLESRLRLWGGQNIDKVLDEFEAFRQLDLEWSITEIGRVMNTLDKMRDLLKMRVDNSNSFYNHDEREQGNEV